MSEFPIHVVDDDRSVRLSLAALLRAHGFDPQTYETAENFLQSFQPGTGGCALIDVRMPGMNGLELQRKLSEVAPGFPVIVVTGHGDVPMAVEVMKAGAIDFLEKPFAEEPLLASVKRAIDTASAGGDQPNARPADIDERLAKLTPREREVLDHLVLGKINKVIAHELDISQRTVEIHRSRVKEKMQAQSLSDLIRMTM